MKEPLVLFVEYFVDGPEGALDLDQRAHATYLVKVTSSDCSRKLRALLELRLSKSSSGEKPTMRMTRTVSHLKASYVDPLRELSPLQELRAYQP